MITVDNIHITSNMKNVLKEWQDEKYGLLDSDLEALENAVCFIASEHECPQAHNDKEALMIIAGLSVIRKKLKKFTGKEYTNE